ncbi:MAG: YtpR family tRNA-binding protein, partial [Anaeroplasmataceae bacterium]
MKVSRNMLKDYLNLDSISNEEIEKIISTYVSEIETTYPLTKANNLVIGEVIECVDHPDSDHLHVCKVKVSNNEVLQIVCGAPNAKQGIKVIVALEGCKLSEDFIIKKAKVRGVESNGMLCSLQELGFEEKYVPEEFKNGIYILSSKAVVGECPLKHLFLDDFVFDIELTSNRSDLLSVEGIAFDIASKLGQKVKVKSFEPKYETVSKDFNINITTLDCLKFNCLYLDN